MPYYKDIYYADGSTPMSVADISLAEAQSIDDKIKDIEGGGLVNFIKDEEALDNFLLKWNNDVPQGAGFFRSDFGVEQRLNAGFKISSGGLNPIKPTSFIPGGSFGSAKFDGINELEFIDCTSLTLNNIFTNEFDKYKIIINVDSTSAVSLHNFRYTQSGVPYSASEYVRASYLADSTPAAGVSGTTNGTVCFLSNHTGTRAYSSEVTICRALDGYYPTALVKSTSWSSATSLQTASWAQVVNNANLPTFDGIFIRNDSNVLMSGTVKIYGYR